METKEPISEPKSEGIKSDNANAVKDAPKSEAAPKTQETSQPNYTVKGGVDMVAVGNPTGASSSPASLRSVGGGARSPSSDYSRSPDGRNVRGGGTNPLEKIDIRKEEDWNEIGAAQLETQIEAQPAAFEGGTIKGNFPVQQNPVFQSDSGNSGVGNLNKPARIRAATMSKDVLLYARGQNDKLQATVVKYPTQTIGNDGASAEVTLHRGDFVLRGMEVTISDGEISAVEFDVDDIGAQSAAVEDLDTRADHARVAWEIVDQKVSEDYFNQINKPENLAQNKYSPLADGFAQAREHVLAAEDIAAVDGIIAAASLRSAAEAYALHRYLRGVYGSGKGAQAQARRAFVGMAGYASDASAHAIKPTTQGVPTATAFVMKYLDSPSKYNNTIGSWFVQQRGVLKPMQDAMAKFDADQFYADKDALKIIQKMFKWQEYEGKLVGIGNMGIVIPYNPNEMFEYNTDSARLLGKLNVVDFVMNGSLRQGTNICSPLFQGIILAIQQLVLPKQSSGTIYIPFTFSADQFTYGNMFVLEGIARAFNFNLKSRGVFDRYAEQYGEDAIVDDITVKLTQADVLNGASFRGLGADAVFEAVNPATKLYLATPESMDFAASAADDHSEAIFAFDQMGQRGSGAYQFGFPILNKGARLEAYDDLMKMGAPTFFKSRDQPLYRPKLSKTWFGNPSDAAGEFDSSCPFFSVDAAGKRAGNACKYVKDPAITDIGEYATITQTVAQVIAVPRVNGRLAPAPLNYLKYQCLDESAADLTALENWGFGASLESKIVDVTFKNTVTSELLTNRVKAIIKPIESYDVTFITEDSYASDVVGNMLNRFCYYAMSGQWSKAISDSLAGVGIYIDPSTDVTGMMYDLVKTEDTSIRYTAGMTVATWINNNLFSFIRNPFNSVFVSDYVEEIYETNVDLGLAAAFNLVGYQQIFWTEEASRIYTEKQKAVGRLLDNNLERAGNITLE